MADQRKLLGAFLQHCETEWDGSIHDLSPGEHLHEVRTLRIGHRATDRDERRTDSQYAQTGALQSALFEHFADSTDRIKGESSILDPRHNSPAGVIETNPGIPGPPQIDWR